MKASEAKALIEQHSPLNKLRKAVNGAIKRACERGTKSSIGFTFAVSEDEVVDTLIEDLKKDGYTIKPYEQEDIYRANRSNDSDEDDVKRGIWIFW